MSQRLRFFATILVACLALAALLWLRPDRTSNFEGSTDADAVQFETIREGATSNSFTACTREQCPLMTGGIASPEFTLPADVLAEAALGAWLAEDKLERLRTSPDGLDIQFLQRSRWLNFADAVSVRFVGLGASRSTVLIHSRSLLGWYDFGVNEIRVRRWLQRLDALPVAND